MKRFLALLIVCVFAQQALGYAIDTDSESDERTGKNDYNENQMMWARRKSMLDSYKTQERESMLESGNSANRLASPSGSISRSAWEHASPSNSAATQINWAGPVGFVPPHPVYFPYYEKVATRLNSSMALGTDQEAKDQIWKSAKEKFEQCVVPGTLSPDPHCLGMMTGIVMQFISAREMAARAVPGVGAMAKQ